LGEIEGSQKHYYLSTNNGAKTEQELANTLLKLQNTTVYLKDIAQIKKKYEDATTLYSYNGKYSISLSIKQNETANALEISKNIKKLIEKTNNTDINIDIYK
jgi:hydrophobic/amphiphilic exporter-1 (mainly G- bacteria), HAE1 family